MGARARDDESKTGLLEREEAMRSREPGGVKQEFWGIILAYDLVRLEMARIAVEVAMSSLRA